MSDHNSPLESGRICCHRCFVAHREDKPDAGRIENLYSYPIKGLSPRPLESVDLEAGQGFPGDRLFGFAKANGGFDPQDPKPLPKTSFVVLMEHARLAGLITEFDDSARVLTVLLDGQTQRFDLASPAGKEQAAAFLFEQLDLSEAERPQFVEGSPHRFTDVSVVSETMMNAVSLINLDSVEAFAGRVETPVDPLRFRANIYFRGWPAFSELECIGRTVRIGDVLLKLLKRTQRCAATEVNPKTAERDLRVPFLLRKNYGHLDMGVYAEVVRGGVVRPGDRLILQEARVSDQVEGLF
ncbi:MOSC domain-containing protein [Nitratireductor sp. XY-223]|uniref:MOSC domain-containing protein n=1 Tax=Nitratireductor sp. XY-223 TaxID=2561926 RepID=UPI001FEDB6C0|nr:MOSC domain-containing protein [Nitratireductor sp. XY-223]